MMMNMWNNAQDAAGRMVSYIDQRFMRQDNAISTIHNMSQQDLNAVRDYCYAMRRESEDRIIQYENNQRQAQMQMNQQMGAELSKLQRECVFLNGKMEGLQEKSKNDGANNEKKAAEPKDGSQVELVVALGNMMEKVIRASAEGNRGERAKDKGQEEPQTDSAGGRAEQAKQSGERTTADDPAPSAVADAPQTAGGTAATAVANAAATTTGPRGRQKKKETSTKLRASELTMMDNHGRSASTQARQTRKKRQSKHDSIYVPSQPSEDESSGERSPSPIQVAAHQPLQKLPPRQPSTNPQSQVQEKTIQRAQWSGNGVGKPLQQTIAKSKSRTHVRSTKDNALHSSMLTAYANDDMTQIKLSNSIIDESLVTVACGESGDTLVARSSLSRITPRQMRELTRDDEVVVAKRKSTQRQQAQRLEVGKTEPFVLQASWEQLSRFPTAVLSDTPIVVDPAIKATIIREIKDKQ